MKVQPHTIGPSFSVKINLWSTETTYWLTDDSLVWETSRQQGCVPYDQIREVQIYKIRYYGSRRSYWRFAIRDSENKQYVLQASYCLGFRNFEDRSLAYYPFIKSLETRIKAANSTASFRTGRHWLSIWDSVFGAALLLLLRFFNAFSIDTASRVAARLALMIGPRLKGHSIARENLIAAYPEKSTAEIDAILTDMWVSLGRSVAEYAHLGTLWDFDSNNDQPGRIYISPANRIRLTAMQTAPGSAMIFGAHIGNWELLCWALGTRTTETAVVYRRAPIAAIERELGKLRQGSKISYIPANINAPFKIKNALKRGAWIGLLVDEAFANGIKVQFFGRTCSASPLFAKIARQFNCPIYGARVIRLPQERFELDLMGPIEPSRDENGDIDVQATTQQITSFIEGWIRECPEQWMWFQRRWR